MTETPNEGGQRHPDGWAAWSKKAGGPLEPLDGLDGAEPEQDDTDGKQPPVTKS